MNQLPILIVYYNLGVGGIQRKILDVTKALHAKHPTRLLYIILRSKTRHEIFLKSVQKHSTVLYYEDRVARKPFYFPIFLFKFMMARRVGSVLVFSGLLMISTMLATSFVFWKKIRIVVSEDGPFPLEKETQKRPFSFLKTLLYRFYFSRVDTILSVNPVLTKHLLRQYNAPKDRTLTIKNWIHPYRPTSKGHKNRYDFIYVGRFEKEKNLLILLRMIESIKQTHPAVTCLMMGSGTEENALHTFIRVRHLTKNIHIIKPSVDVEKHFSQSRIFILPSKAEGQSLATLEAINIGLPVLCSNFPGMDTQLKKLCTIYSSEKDLLKKALSLLQRPSSFAQIAAKKFVHKRFSTKNMLPYLTALQARQ